MTNEAVAGDGAPLVEFSQRTHATIIKLQNKTCCFFFQLPCSSDDEDGEEDMRVFCCLEVQTPRGLSMLKEMFDIVNNCVLYFMNPTAEIQNTTDIHDM